MSSQVPGDSEDLRDGPRRAAQAALGADHPAGPPVELAKAELTQKGKQAGMGAGLFGGAGVRAGRPGRPDRLRGPA